MSDNGKVNILIVDDKPDKVLSLEAVLEDLQQNLVRAYSGREALRALLHDDFAVILLDVNMPGMDGFETAQLIRQRKSTEQIPIIFVTAYGDEDHLARGYSLGAVDYIQTPLVPDVLRTKVSVFVDLFNKTEQVRRQAHFLRRRASQLQKLAAASTAINSALSMEKMLQTITDVARDVIECEQAITLFVLGTASSKRPPRTQSATSFSEKYSNWRGRKLALDMVATTVVAQSRSATRLTDAELRDHPDWEIVRNLEIPPIVGGMLAAPLTGRDGSSLGVIYLAERSDGEFTNDDEAVLVQLAQMASIALENTIFAEERETNRIKDEFLSTLSHELRTPLGAILGWTHLLRMEQLSEEAEHGVDVIERNARAQAKLIEDMLDVSRVTAGKLKLNSRQIRLSSVVNAAVDSIRPTAEAKEIAVEVSLGDEDDRICGDPDRLQQVVWNLLSNAVKFTQAKGHVAVQLQRLGESMRIVVSDDGPGIHPRFLPHVFDRFRQADSSSTRQHGGLGIGLTIVRHIVELHGGRVTAASAGEGRGATFTVELPVSPPAPAFPGNTDVDVAPPASAAPSPAAARRAISLAGARILVVDDEPDAREVIAEMLRRADARVETAGSVDEALERMSHGWPDILVTDIAMPERDGYELLRLVRASSAARPHCLPAIALTAYAREEDRLRALDAGFQDHIAKPVDTEKFLSLVGNLICQSAANVKSSPDVVTAQPVSNLN